MNVLYCTCTMYQYGGDIHIHCTSHMYSICWLDVSFLMLNVASTMTLILAPSISFIHSRCRYMYTYMNTEILFVSSILSPLSSPSPSSLSQFGFWDPRSDDDQLAVTSIHFQEELLAVGLHGGVALLFNLNSQSAVIDMKVKGVYCMYRISLCTVNGC